MLFPASPKHKPVTWVLVADSTQARLYECHEKTKKGLELVALPEVTRRTEGEKGEELSQGFMQTITLKLRHAYARKYFNQLVVVAPSWMLGCFKDFLDPDTLRHIIASVPHELMHDINPELVDHIRHALAYANVA